MGDKRSSRQTLAPLFKVLGSVLVVLMFMVWQHVQANQYEQELKILRKEEDELIFQNARLQSQINQWISPSHLETMARKDLGMIPLDPQHRVRVDLP